MDTLETIVNDDDIKSKQTDSTFKTIIDLFVEPTRAFQSLKLKPRWLTPFILCALATVAFTVLTWDMVLEDRIGAIESNNSLGSEQADQQIATLRQMQQGDLSDIAKIDISSFLIGIGFITAGQLVNLFAMSLIIWLALHLVAQNFSFKSILSVCSFTMLVSILEMSITLPLILVKNTMKIYLGLAILLPGQWENSPLFNICSKLDIFSVWTALLLMFGIAIVTGASKKKVAITIGYLWVIWLLLAMLLGNFQLIGIG